MGPSLDPPPQTTKGTARPFGIPSLCCLSLIGFLSENGYLRESDFSL